MGALGENVENELGSIYDPQLEFILQVTSLSRRQTFIENRQCGGALMRQVAQFSDLAATDKGAGVNFLKALEDLAGDLGAGTLGQCAKLFKRILGRNPVDIAKGDTNQDGALAIGCGYLIGRQGYSLRLNCGKCIRLRPPVEPLIPPPQERKSARLRPRSSLSERP